MIKQYRVTVTGVNGVHFTRILCANSEQEAIQRAKRMSLALSPKVRAVALPTAK